jgi:hypothetical protein
MRDNEGMREKYSVSVEPWNESVTGRIVSMHTA